MNLKKDGKLKMGPLWDFETAFNVKYPSTGFVVKNSSWYSRLFEDPAFVSKVKERFNFFYGQKEAIFREINDNAQYLRYAVVENENRWHTLYTYNWRNANIWGSYDNEVQFMKQWLNARLEWMKGIYDKM